MGETASSADRDLATKLEEINAEFEMVALRIKGGRFYVRGSRFPPKPGSESVLRHELPTGCKATFSSLRIAKAIAAEIDSKLIRNVFDWLPYLKGKNKPVELVGEWIARLEEDHWSRTPCNPDTINTFNKNYAYPYRSLPSSAILSSDLLKKTLAQKTKPGKKSRLTYATAFTRLAKFAGLEDLEKIRE